MADEWYIHTKFVAEYVIYLQTKFRMAKSNYSLIVVIEAKDRLHVDAIFSLCIHKTKQNKKALAKPDIFRRYCNYTKILHAPHQVAL